MTTVGSAQDVYDRLISNLPASWFGSGHPIVDILLAGYVDTGVFNYSQISYVKKQTRIKTATDINLDQISRDFLGDLLPRRNGESDDSYRNRLLATILQEKCTRAALLRALFVLTGRHATAFEPERSLDTGAYNVPSTMGYRTAGRYGSSSYAYQGFIDVYVDPFEGMANYSGYNQYFGGYNASGGAAVLWYGGQSLNSTPIADSDIYKLINLTKVYGTIVWVRIHRERAPVPTPMMETEGGDIMITEFGDFIIVAE